MTDDDEAPTPRVTGSRAMAAGYGSEARAFAARLRARGGASEGILARRLELLAERFDRSAGAPEARRPTLAERAADIGRLGELLDQARRALA